MSFWLLMPLQHAHWVPWGLRCHTGLRPFGRPATGNPMFPARQKFDACRFSVRSFPSFICGWLERLTECCTTKSLGFTSTPPHSPGVHVTCRVNPSKNLPIELEFRQCSLNRVHLTL